MSFNIYIYTHIELIRWGPENKCNSCMVFPMNNGASL